jgi:hypothetical protein
MLSRPQHLELALVAEIPSYWLLVIGYWLLVIGYWLLGIDYWALIIITNN